MFHGFCAILLLWLTSAFKTLHLQLFHLILTYEHGNEVTYHGRGGRKWARNSKCGYTGWAWCRLHLRDEGICARDVIYPIAYNLHLEPTRQTCLQRDGCSFKLRLSSGGIDEECCILARDSQGKQAHDVRRHVTQESRWISDYTVPHARRQSYAMCCIMTWKAVFISCTILVT